jgi:hypothetical protein
MAANFEEVVCTQFYSKLGLPYTIGSTFSVVIQQYMAGLIWRKIDWDTIGQHFGIFEFIAWGTTQLE